MDIQTEKLKLIDWIVQQENTNLIEKLVDLTKVLEKSKVELSAPNGQKSQLKQLFKEAQQVNAFSGITNPVEWQKNIRDEWE